MRYRILAGFLGVLLSACRTASGDPLPLSMGGTLSTLGPGLSLTGSFEPNFLTAELDAALIAYSHSVSSEGNTYGGTTHLVSVGLLGNVYPFRGAFHLSMGAYYLDQHRPLEWHLQGADYRINGQSYTPAELTGLTGRVEYAHGAPYIGIGWGNPTVGAGWHVIGRLGVLYEGKPHVDFVGVTTLTGTQRTALYDNLDTQRRGLQNDLSRPLYPVIGIGVAFRF